MSGRTRAHVSGSAPGTRRSAGPSQIVTDRRSWVRGTNTNETNSSETQSRDETREVKSVARRCGVRCQHVWPTGLAVALNCGTQDHHPPLWWFPCSRDFSKLSQGCRRLPSAAANAHLGEDSGGMSLSHQPQSRAHTERLSGIEERLDLGATASPAGIWSPESFRRPNR